MKLDKKPQSQIECLSASHGLRNSLDNSFTELNQLSNGTDHFGQGLSYVTSPKELQLRIISVDKEPDPFRSCVETKAQECSKTDYDNRVTSTLKDNFKETDKERGRRLSAEAKDQLNLSLKGNVQMKYSFILCSDCTEDKAIKYSYAVIVKSEAERMNVEVKELKKMEMKKYELEQKNMQRKEAEKTKMERRWDQMMPVGKDADETFCKWLVTDGSAEEDKEEKGSLEINNSQKAMVSEKRKSCENADDDIEEFDERYSRAVDETMEIIEKWEDEKDEKVKTVKKYKEKAMVRRSEEDGQEKVRYSPQVGEFELNLEIILGKESDLIKQNESKVKEILMTSGVVFPVNLEERSIVSEATSHEEPPCLEAISVTCADDCTVFIEDRSVVALPAVYESREKTSESVDNNFYVETGGCEEMFKLKTSKATSSPVETTDEGNSILCLSCCEFFVSKFKRYYNALSPTSMSWINISSHTYKDSSKTSDQQSVSGVGHGDDRNRSGSPRECSGFLGSFGGKCLSYSRPGSGGAGGSFGSSGGGGGRGGGDDNWENRRHLDFTGGRRKRKQDKKLKKKCRLEHGILTKEQILFVTGWLLNRSHSVPDALSELLKCFKICVQGGHSSIDACKICNAVLLMLRHSSNCAIELCKLCDGIVLLCSSEDQPNLLKSVTEQLFCPRSASRDQFKKDLRDQFAELLASEEETTSESDNDSTIVSQSSGNIYSNNAPPVLVELNIQATGHDPKNEEWDHGFVQGPPIEAEGRFNSEYPPFNMNYQSFYPPNELRNYSVPADSRHARSGSVVYGGKELVRAMVGCWQESAEHQRSSDNQRHRLHHTFISNRAGVILQSQADKLRIQNNNYEPDEEWNLVTECLGTGVSGSCYAGCDSQTDFTFCVKKIPLHKFYADEILIWLEMEHPDIVELYGVIVYDSFVFVIQELITGPTLKEHITEKKALNSFESLMYLQHLLELLVYLKCKNVIHNDIKADNILMREPGKSTRLVLIDFGLASHTSYVQPGCHPVGGQTHWSPEKAASEGYSFPADLWAAMAVFVHMLSGVEPWVVRFKHTSLLHCIIKQHSPPLEDVPKDLPWQVHELIKEGWTVDPLTRPSASDLLRTDAFKLLDIDPSMELFVSHLSHVESFEIELPNADSILEESETEELISLAQQHFSMNQQSQPSPAGTSSGFAEMRLNSFARSFHSSERPPHVESPFDRPGVTFPSGVNTSRPLRVLPPLEEYRFEHQFELFLDQIKMVEDRKKYSPPVDMEIIDDLSLIYDDLSFGGGILQQVFFVKNPSVLEDIQSVAAEQSNASLGSIPAKPQEQGSGLHRVKLCTWDETSINEAMPPVAEVKGPPPSIPTVVEGCMLSDEEENRSLQLQSNDGKDDVDRATIPSSSLDVFHNNSMGTTVKMMLNGHRVYCIHLHPGTECSWSEILRKASTQIHDRGVVAFTAELVVNDQRETVDVSATIPSVPEIVVETVPLTAVQDYNWKVEDSRIIYHPNYQGHFGPEFDD